jgi:hypothetical protein
VLRAGFTIEPGGAPDLWAHVIGPARVRPGRPARYYVAFGNRGAVDATAVPLGITVPSAEPFAPFTPNFIVSPPPVHEGQVPAEWSGVPLHADTGASSGVRSILLLLPVVPAGFTGVLEFTLKLDETGPFEITFGIGAPYIAGSVNPRVVDAFLAGSRAYAERTFGAAFPPDAVVRQYVMDQLESAVAAGFASLVASQGADLRVYSVSHLLIDAARFAAVHPE